MNTTMTTIAAAASLCLALAGCGGGGDSSAAPADGIQAASPSGDTGQAASQSAGSVPTLVQRIAAAKATAESSSNDCATIGPFYWEVGNASARLASGSVDRPLNPRHYDADTVMSIASASKWLYAAYVVQRLPELDQQTVQYLRFTSGYTHFEWCLPDQTVRECQQMGDNDLHDDQTDGKFYYNGGHMQNHAVLMGLGPLQNAGLAAALRSQLGVDVALAYSQPQLAGGVVSTPSDYARFLRKLLDGSLKLGSMLGDYKVCTNPDTCPTALYTPVPHTESPHYALGHWVEDDLTASDGAFSSAGGMGFYPWIDAKREYYGVLAREVPQQGAGYESALCGRRIRKAFATGVAQ